MDVGKEFLTLSHWVWNRQNVITAYSGSLDREVDMSPKQSQKMQYWLPLLENELAEAKKDLECFLVKNPEFRTL